MRLEATVPNVGGRHALGSGRVRVQGARRAQLSTADAELMGGLPAARVGDRPLEAGVRASWRPVVAQGARAAVEQYRRLAGSLLRAQAVDGVTVVMIASSVPGEGKSLTTSNLALTLCKSYRRKTLVFDADLRRPSQHEIFRVRSRGGLNDYLISGRVEDLDPVEPYPNLKLVTAGRATADPLAGLTSTRMKNIVAEAASTFDFVLIDTPPVTLMSDAHLLSSLADAVVLVVGAGHTQHDAVVRAVETIGRDRLLGVVLNRAVDDVASQEHYATYY